MINYDEFDEIGDMFDLSTSLAKIHDGWTTDEIVDFYMGSPPEQIKKAISDFKYAGRTDVLKPLKKLL